MKSTDLIGHIKFLLWRQLNGCSMTRPFLSLRRAWLARLSFLLVLQATPSLQRLPFLPGWVWQCKTTTTQGVATLDFECASFLQITSCRCWLILPILPMTPSTMRTSGNLIFWIYSWVINTSVCVCVWRGGYIDPWKSISIWQDST